MVGAERMTAEERKEAIIRAAIPLFAKQGFNGTTTREIAQAAGVSEALLYRHFPSKEAMYHSLKSVCCTEGSQIDEMIPTLKPSTSTLVHLITLLVGHISKSDGSRGEEGISNEHVHRLMAKSYLEDGAFARAFMHEKLLHWEKILVECLQAADESGDRVPSAVDPRCGAWFSHHVGVALGLFDLPAEKVIDYGVDRETLVHEAIRFCLRGMGLTDKAIEAHFNPEILRMTKVNLF